MNTASHEPPAVDPWLWAETFSATMAAGVDPLGIGRRQREQRLAALLQAASRSPLYRARLGAAGQPRLQTLQPVDKPELMHRFDDWATDRRITLDSVQRFLDGTGHLADAYLGQYLVWTSSGTSGKPGIFVQDVRCLAAFEALDALRLRGSPPGLPLTAWSMGRRFAFVGATGGHFAGAASIERLKRLVGAATAGPMGWLAPQVQSFSVQTPLRELAQALQAFKPSVLITYPSCAAALAQLQADAALKLELAEIWVGGEQLSDTQRVQIRQAFGCALRNNYGASEFFSIAFECAHGRMHLNDDWVILEPIDRHDRPVATGDLSHAVLLTNLANHTQPLLRYRLDDAIRFTGLACPCGCAFPVIEVQGRSADTLVLHDAHDREVTVLPLALETAIENDSCVTQFQLVCTAPDAVELRLETEAQQGPADYERARSALHGFLVRHGLGNVRIAHGRHPPLRDKASGKLRRVLIAPPAAH